MSKEQRQSLKLWKPGSFDACKNAAAPMIAMLGRLELDTEVSDAGMETAESDDCRELSKKDGDVNGVLAVTLEGARFSCKNEWKFINPFTQSISRLCQVSHQTSGEQLEELQISSGGEYPQIQSLQSSE